MKRVVAALVATVGGLALLANFHTAAGLKPRALTAPTTSSSTTAPVSGPPPSGPTPGSTSTTLASGTRQLDGQIEPTQFGDVQVRVILSGTRVTDVTPLQMPFDHQRSEEISQAVAPLLHDEVLKAQNAHIDLISGATYTSYAYQQSLQAALDQLKK